MRCRCRFDGEEKPISQFSAVQAVDPYLKHCKPFVFREGFLPQPVVRFTGERSINGQLKDGFLTSFVNLSHVRRISSLDEHAGILDDCLVFYPASDSMPAI